MNWSDPQKKAIEDIDHNLLVAAAAGSGKTAVLVERIRRLVVEKGVSLDNMLVVTFTNAAAAEMKEKIRKELTKELKDCKDKEQYAYLKEQLRLLPKANISTFHGFAQKVIKNFFYLVDVEPGYSICDAKDSILLMENAVSKLMEKEYLEGREDFLAFMDNFSDANSDINVRELLTKSYEKLMAMPYPMQWLEESIDILRDKDHFTEAPAYKEFWRIVKGNLKEMIEISQVIKAKIDGADLKDLSVVANENVDKLKELMADIDAEMDFDAFKKKLDQFKFKSLSAKGDEKARYMLIQPEVQALGKQRATLRKELQDGFFAKSLEEHLETVSETAVLAETLMRLIKELDRLFMEEKKSKKTLTFNDLEHYCLTILKTEEASGYYRDKFQFIFIDEYQDTNYVQEEIINFIKRPNNLFLVGDVKQSIYSFRQAEPEIFKDKYSRYGDDEEALSRVIDLNMNYRCKQPIIDKVNEIFKVRMEGYDDRAQLYYGGDYDGDLVYAPEILVVDKPSKSEEKDNPDADMKALEMEAFRTAELIKGLVGKPYYDSKAQCEKTIKCGDIVILLRSIKNGKGEAYQEALRKVGIDAYLESDEGYFDTMEITVFMNLLEIIDNSRQDTQLISVLHSEIFGLRSDELAEIRSHHRRGSFYQALWAYALSEEDNVDLALKQRCLDFFEKIKGWKRDSQIMSLGKFIWKLMEETGYYIIMGAMPGGDRKQANLRLLVDRAEAFAGKNQGTIYSFVRYINSIKEKKIDMGEAKMVGEKDDIVRIMTIHHSKGLEFPVVIVGSCDTQFRLGDSGSLVIDRDLGLGIHRYNVDTHLEETTFVERVIKEKKKRDDREEELRVLYVALTRAKDILYIVGVSEKWEKLAYPDEGMPPKKTSYLNWLAGTKGFRRVPPPLDLPEEEEAEGDESEDLKVLFDWEVDDKTADLIKKKMEDSYPYAIKNIKTKYAATAFGKEPGAHWTQITVPAFARTEKGKLPASRIGTVYHGIMERLDFAKTADPEYIEKKVEEFLERGIFTPEEIDAVPVNTVRNFFETEIGQRAVKASAEGRLSKEQPFTVKAEKEGEPVLVQGVIDCYFEEDGELVLIDYKNSHISHTKDYISELERVKEQYQQQANIYRSALKVATGKDVKEAYLYLAQEIQFIEM